MKNPFEQNDKKLLIIGITAGVAIAGAAAYLLLTETGSEVRRQLTGHIGRMRDTFMGNLAEEGAPMLEAQS